MNRTIVTIKFPISRCYNKIGTIEVKMMFQLSKVRSKVDIVIRLIYLGPLEVIK